MQKVILLTGATDGIGLETAKLLAEQGHHLVLHGRNASKLAELKNALSNDDNQIDTLVADLSKMAEVHQMIVEVKQKYRHLDVLINNAGVFNTPNTITDDGFDVRFAVNTFAPYLLTLQLLPLFDQNGRVVNLSSAAQASVNFDALVGQSSLSSGEAYAQSKLALTMWSCELGTQHQQQGPMIVAVNPKSYLGSKMVKEAYGIAGESLALGADILIRAALSDEFATAHGKYYNNDIGAFANPHQDALSSAKNQQLMAKMDQILASYL